jgi:two-component system, OmpR family, phosphate regulon response regulator PhoB
MSNIVQRILIIEDEPSIAELIAVNVAHAGFESQRAMQADEALMLMQQSLPDLIILDWMLPGKSGVQFAKELRSDLKTSAIPILMLTAKGEELDKVTGLDAGADDYVTKPFSPKELIARVKALLRRYDGTLTDKPLIVGPLSLDSISHRVLFSGDDQVPEEIPMGPTEYKLLSFLMNNPERVHSRANLLDHVWGNESYIEDRTVDVHIKRLRDALAIKHCDEMIETVRGAGYRLSRLWRRES